MPAAVLLLMDFCLHGSNIEKLENPANDRVTNIGVRVKATSYLEVERAIVNTQSAQHSSNIVST